MRLINDIIGQRLNLLLARSRCSECYSEFESADIFVGDRMTFLYSEKRFYSLYSKPNSKQQILNGFSVPYVGTDMFLRKIMTLPKQRKMGDMLIAIMSCDYCGKEHKTEINIRNNTSIHSK